MELEQPKGNDNENPHPLLIDLIIETVIGFMDYESKRSGRLVCSKWNEAILPEFVKVASVNIKFDTERLFILENELTSILHLNSDESRRFQIVNIHSMKWLQSATFRNWLINYGKNIQIMSLGKGEEDDVDDLEDVEEISLSDLETLLLEWCPNLKELRLPIPCIETSQLPNPVPLSQRRPESALEILRLGSSKWYKDDYEDIGIIAQLALQLAPNLTVLTMNSCQKRGVDLLLNNIRESPLAPAVEKLTVLDLHKQLMNDYIVDQLTKLNFSSLRKLGIGDVGEVEDSTRFCSVNLLLSNVSSTLEDLSFGETYHGSLRIRETPRMPKLKKFFNHHLRGWAIQNLDFLIGFPNLMYCVLDSRCVDFCGHAKWLFEPESGQQDIRLKREPHSNLVSFGMKCGIRDAIVPRNIVQCFPNLRTLSIKLMKYTLPIDQCVDELSKLQKLELLWIETSRPFENDFDYTARSYFTKFKSLKSLVVEDDTHIYFTMGESFSRLLDLKSLTCKMRNELMVDEGLLEKLKIKLKDNHFFHM